MNLYEIATQYQTLLEGVTVDEETGEALGLEALDELQVSFDEKAESVACFIKNQVAMSGALKAESDALLQRRKAIDAKTDRLKAYLTSACETLGHTKVETPRCKIGFRSSTSVEILDPDLVPTRYTHMEMVRKIDKSVISTCLKAGASVDGATLVTKQNIQIM